MERSGVRRSSPQSGRELPAAGVEPGELYLLPVRLRRAVEPGRLDPANAPYVLETLRLAADGCLSGAFAAMVTGPVHKGVINDAGIAFTGHTEYLAEHTGGTPVMMLTCPGLRVALASKAKVSEDDVEDFAQDALVKILAALDSFRGESRLTTWAHKIAIRVALTELRRRRWRDVSLDSLIHSTDADFLPDTLADPAATPEEKAIQNMVLETMRRVIAEDLTDKQRKSLVAARVHGMPLEEVARRMGTNRNALYKLLHDARQRLRKELMTKGLPPEEVLSAFGLKAKVRDRQPTASKSRGVE